LFMEKERMKSPPAWWRLDRNHVPACKARA